MRERGPGRGDATHVVRRRHEDGLGQARRVARHHVHRVDAQLTPVAVSPEAHLKDEQLLKDNRRFNTRQYTVVCFWG